MKFSAEAADQLYPQEPPGSHIHLDAYNSLESGSAELIIERREA